MGFGYTVGITLDSELAANYRGKGSFGWGGAAGTSSWADPENELVAVLMLQQEHGAGRGGVLGFSLGGNFALRVARALQIPTLAICPAIDPEATMRAIDAGWTGYRWYFIRKWHRALKAKQQAFPDRYDFSPARRQRDLQACH